MKVKSKPISEKIAKNEKWVLFCKPNKALKENEKEDHIWSWKSTFVQKRVESLREEKARVKSSK